jgi:putative nucleotidyltransferase with HDIG domain
MPAHALAAAPSARTSARAVAEAAERLAPPSGAPRPEAAARLLHLVNGALDGRAVDSLERASLLIGERTMRGLVLAASTLDLLEAPLPVYGVARGALPRHCEDVAVTARALVGRRFARLATEAYVAGLIHDIGKPVLAAAAPGPRAAADGAAAEREAFGTDHARVGSWIARRWGLPEDLALAVERHHDREPPTEPLARALWLADLEVHARAGRPAAIARLASAGSAARLQGGTAPQEWVPRSR